MRIFRQASSRNTVSVFKEIPRCITNQPGIPGTAHFENGVQYHIGCIGCLNPRCINFSEDEIECAELSDFPSDKTTNVCPVNAIKWDESSSVPTIDSQACINCGVCVSRCPVGALYFTVDGTISLYSAAAQCVEIVAANASTKFHHKRHVRHLLQLPKTGILINTSDRIFETIYEKLFNLPSNYHNLVVRSLLIALGCRCSISRIGDVYTRMDAVYHSEGGSFGAVEVEFGRDTLDASRGILDDIAILKTRYGVPTNNNKAIVICCQLPNVRQGYWQVVRDIKNVEGIKIGTITLGALMLLVWHRCIFQPEADRYYLDFDNTDLRRILCSQINHDGINITQKFLGILEPMK